MRKIVCVAAWFFGASSALAEPQGQQEQARQQLEHEHLTLAEATDMIANAIDANHDHRVSRAEWLAYWPAPTGISTRYNPARDFDGYDHNHDGFLDGRQEALPAVQQAVRAAQDDCDKNVDHVFSGADELSCLVDYLTQHPPKRASTTPPRPGAARVSGSLAQPSGGQGPVGGEQIHELAAARLDANHDNRISPAEWRNLTQETDFDAYDSNKNGFIDGSETARAVAHMVDVIITDCDGDFDQVLSDPQELSCLAHYIPPEQPTQSASTTTGQTGTPRASGPSATLTIDASVRVLGPGRVFAPVANAPVYLSARDLEQTLASAGLVRPTPVDAWLQACRARTLACHQGMDAVRGSDPAARGLTDAQGHFTFTHAPVGHFFVVLIGDIAPGHTLIWCVPIDIHAGENELTLAGHNLYVSPQ